MFNNIIAASLLTAVVLSQAAGESGDNTAVCSGDSIDSYDLPFHIGGIFIVFVVSAAGMFGAMFVDGFKIPIIGQLLHILKFFGMGIIAGTAWIHLLPDAFSQFSNPCLGDSWKSYGTNYVGLFGVAASFMVQLLELASSQHTHEHEHEHILKDLDHLHHTHGSAKEDMDESSITEPIAVALDHNITIESIDPHKHQHVDPNKRFQTIILESGILVHSLIIGLTLGVTPDTGFVSLLIAICFHQMFEGMALGILISNAKFDTKVKYVLGFLYPLTTPIGISIGVGVRNVFNANDPKMILIQGILDSISAGILFYNCYAELISNEVNHSPSFNRFSKKFKAACFISMYAGAAAMAIIGIWA
ncbi:high-affinity Zn(2+) transporter zrt1 [Terramyces sp. JEL0728]|nr:high-affinity Zn(2+) transporter zrt1 [Terramyces sp. JEL0728]